MDNSDLDSILEQLSLGFGDPGYRASVYAAVVRHIKRTRGEISPLQKACASNFHGISRTVDASEVQDSCSVRANLRARRIAVQLFDEKGQLLKEQLGQAVGFVKETLYSLGPDRLVDKPRQEHLLRCLQSLHTSEALQRALLAIQAPERNPTGSELVRQTLRLEPNTRVTDLHARQAGLAAWLVYLRQNVGSCFATAPAIVVQQDQPLAFFKDMAELLATGQLKRVYAGEEYAAPMSPSWGMADLLKPLLIKREKGPDDREIISPPIWSSPGVVMALTSAGILDAEQSLRERVDACRELIVSLFDAISPDQLNAGMWVTVDSIFSSLLMRHLDLTDEQLKEFEKRQSASHFGPLQTMAGTTPESGGVGGRSSSYYLLLNQARNEFKALTDNALLRSWEYSVASFSESKSSFSRYNLYSSLGLKPEEPGGIGECLYNELNETVQELNREVQEHQETCEQAAANVEYVRGRLRRARDEQEAQWLKIDYQQRSGELHHYQELRDMAAQRAQRMANLFNQLLDMYLEKFPVYFQEVYDAELHEVDTGPYDDSPAGFRLLYKAGRAATGQWTRVQSPQAFVDALAGFFQMTENEILHMEEFEGLEQEISRLVTKLVGHVRSEEFLVSAFDRMARAHQMRPIKNPLENLDKVEKKPWVYTSGGTVNNLVASYFAGGDLPQERSRWVESPTELCAFLIDCVKEAPASIRDDIEDDHDIKLLIHSPTHAFLFKPGAERFRQGWEDESYTYTWIRDQFLLKAEYQVRRIQLDREMMQRVVDEVAQALPARYRDPFRMEFGSISGSRSCQMFRQQVVNGIRMSDSVLGQLNPSQVGAIVDEKMVEMLPFCRGDKLEEWAKRIFRNFDSKNYEGYVALFRALVNFETRQRVYSSLELLDLLCSIVMLYHQRPTFPQDMESGLIRSMREEGALLPQPLVFADTNWVRHYFAFVLNPGTNELELWRVEEQALKGAPMTQWRKWLDGSQKEPDWGVLINRYQYLLA